jgi:uncharacterized protein involved in exopolysaccharide biosynthesis
MSDARTAFEDHSSVTLGVKDGLISIGVTDYEPSVAAQIANGYVDEYRKFSARLAITEASQRRLFFEKQLLDANADLADAEDALKGTERSTGLIQVESQARSLVESAAGLRAQIVAAEVRLQGMRSYASDNNPDLLRQEQELAELRTQLANLSGNRKQSNTGLILPKGNLPDAAVEYARKLRNVKYYETISEMVARQLETAKLDEARQGAEIQIVDPAIIPDKRSFPNRSLTVIVASFVGLLSACIWTLFRAGLDRLK